MSPPPVCPLNSKQSPDSANWCASARFPALDTPSPAPCQQLRLSSQCHGHRYKAAASMPMAMLETVVNPALERLSEKGLLTGCHCRGIGGCRPRRRAGLLQQLPAVLQVEHERRIADFGANAGNLHPPTSLKIFSRFKPARGPSTLSPLAFFRRLSATLLADDRRSAVYWRSRTVSGPPNAF